jgi:type IV fimbrial biogenesis protein FimT
MQGRSKSLRTLRSSGFTLVELLAVITIVAILFAIGVPSYRSFTRASRVSTEINELLGDMQFARSEALKRGRPVTACISTDGTSCTGGTLWQGGWIVFSDSNTNATVDGAESVLRVRRPLAGGDAIQEANSLAAITFNRAGFALNLPNAGALLKLHDPTNNSAFTRCLAISMAGMIMTQKPATAPATCT